MLRDCWLHLSALTTGPELRNRKIDDHAAESFGLSAALLRRMQRRGELRTAMTALRGGNCRPSMPGPRRLHLLPAGRSFRAEACRGRGTVVIGRVERADPRDGRRYVHRAARRMAHGSQGRAGDFRAWPAIKRLPIPSFMYCNAPTIRGVTCI